jgi:NTE family protein
MKPKLGLALGGGAAKGWSHIGVLRALEKLGIEADIVVGTSMGSLVGAAWVTGNLDDLEEWVNDLHWADVLLLLDIRLSGGLIHGDKVIDHLSERMKGILIESMDKAFAAVATDLDNGNEVWLREGEVLDAVRASIALPGLFSPIKLQDRWLVDGGLVNPIPVSLCRAMGADVVIAVDLTAQVFFQKPSLESDAAQEVSPDSVEGSSLSTDRLADLLQGMVGRLRGGADGKDSLPSLLDVAFRSLHIMTSRIARSRLAGEPAELLITPRVAEIGLMKFHRARDAIKLGHAAVERHIPELENLREYLQR